MSSQDDSSPNHAVARRGGDQEQGYIRYNARRYTSKASSAPPLQPLTNSRHQRCLAVTSLGILAGLMLVVITVLTTETHAGFSWTTESWLWNTRLPGSGEGATPGSGLDQPPTTGLEELEETMKRQQRDMEIAEKTMKKDAAAGGEDDDDDEEEEGKGKKDGEQEESRKKAEEDRETEKLEEQEREEEIRENTAEGESETRLDEVSRTYWPKDWVHPGANPQKYKEQCETWFPKGRTAIVTLAVGDAAARQAVGLVQSIRDVVTCPGIDVIVMVTGGGSGSDDCKQGKLDKSLYKSCQDKEISDPRVAVSEHILDTLKSLGASIRIVEPLGLDSKYIKIPGGRSFFWGMAFNKLRLFGFTEYQKILWLDGDVFLLKNVDHLLWYPELTAAYTNDCCNRNAPTKITGGMWVVEPSEARMKQIEALIYQESPMVKAGLEPATWHFGDMSMMLALFTSAKRAPTLFPGSIDPRQAKFNGFEEERKVDMNLTEPGKLLIAGENDITLQPLVPELQKGGEPSDFNWGDEVGQKYGIKPKKVWHMLNASYDFLPGDCLSNCLPHRDKGPDFFLSLHFSCMPPKYSKPGSYPSFRKLQESMQSFETCLATYYGFWADAYKRAVGSRKDKDRWMN